MTEVLAPHALDARRVIVVAPHPDDEALGCGGLVWHLARLRRRVHVLFVTDGGASHLHSPTWPRARLAATREAEAEAALRELGLDAAARTFLRLPDADMPLPGSPGDAAALRGVTALMREVAPDLVLLPWRRDPHRDHRDAWSLVTRALSEAGMAPATLEYAIWLDEIGAADDHPRPGEMERVGFAIGDALPAKRRAVAAHRSQCGALIHDDPTAFSLTEATIERLTGPVEFYWRPL
ncbi:PIG-L deacetylase family protein [Aureimonas phyllosphaerae]|uniref:LmbE family N-acetylglucosaminyl deacetylase n=1 Tax=Aureimonas phyllosphaerae TaxID=1166078 RepID=A0A7W6FV59_9HYPH|nr:PIG-L deacetylase family protein [Aureimonas phyllosphaerae]MBB3936944.1 LmbE family N-acetylglucosaminyl deacetylase [Aureimonas phyllosphaerae]MBB3960941.1 LmbE family N-acetylglucosaminyl deacetylase [Aureimonas phyllosphaerae]SFF27731.1 N-acetylglucosaminyl deacetylase, LmbE family [Aureimonas phyllosphaerae]